MMFYVSEFQKLWRSVPVDSMDDEKIEDYLKRQGITSMQESGPKKVVCISAEFYTFSQKLNKIRASKCIKNCAYAVEYFWPLQAAVVFKMCYSITMPFIFHLHNLH